MQISYTEQTTIKVARLTLEKYGEILSRLNKVATGRTRNSLHYEYDVTPTEVSIKIRSDVGLLFIELGKRANTKLPVRKVNGVWQLVPRLEEWRKAVGFGGTDWQLAYTIAKNPREGIPVTDMVLQELRPIFAALLLQDAKDVIVSTLRQQTKEVFKNL